MGERRGNKGEGRSDKVNHLRRPIKKKETNKKAFVCSQAFIGRFSAAAVTEDRMLIKRRQETGSVGLPLSGFSQDRRSHASLTPPLPRPLLPALR